MCSACLKPVHPMEKMAANKLILHQNCFCCKQCQKKLSTHNYASLYGEFYCNFHYQELFERKGNYDGGFGHKSHKDQWFQKNKATDEPDAVTPTKLTKSKLSKESRESFAGEPIKRESSANVLDTRESFAREPAHSSGADVKGKLKVSWPPQKKSTGVNLAPQTYVNKKTSEIGTAATLSTSLPDNSQLMRNHDREKKDKMTRLSSSFISATKEQPKTTHHNSAVKLPSEEKPPRSNPTIAGHFQGSISEMVHHFEKGATVINQKPDQKNGAPTSKTNYSPLSNRLDAYANKDRKSVQFASHMNDAQPVLSAKMTTKTKAEESSTQLSDQKSKDFKDVSGKSNFDRLLLQFRKEQSASEKYLEIPENKGRVETSKMSNQEPGVNIESRQKIQQTDITVLNGGADKVDSLSLTKTLNSAKEVLKQEEPSKIIHVSPKDSVNSCESENLIPPHSPAEHMSGGEASLEKNKNHFERTDSVNDQEKRDNRRNPVARANSLKDSVKQAEKTKGKPGSLSKAKNPLAKLFTSGGNDKTNKTEPKDAKKPDVKSGSGLLGKLFQSPLEKTEDPKQLAVQNEIKDKIHAENKKTEKINEEAKKDVQKEGNMSQLLPQEQEAGEHTKEKSHPAKPDVKKQDVKASDGLLGGLSQSSLEKTKETKEMAVQNEINETKHADDKKSEKVNKEVIKEMQKEHSVSQELPQKQETGEHNTEKSHSAEPDAKKPDVKPTDGLLDGLSQSALEKTEHPKQLSVQNEINETKDADDKKSEKVNKEVIKEMQKERSVSQEFPQEQEAGGHTKEKSNSAEPDAKKPDVKPTDGLLDGLSQFTLEKTEETKQLTVQNEINENKHVDDKNSKKVSEEVTKEMQRERSVFQEHPQEQEAGEHTKEKSPSPEPDAKKPDVRPTGGLLDGLSQSSLEKTEETKELAVQKEVNEKKPTDEKNSKVNEEVTKEMQRERSMSQEHLQEQETGEHTKEKSHSAEPEAKKPDVKPTDGLLDGLSQSSLEKTEDTKHLTVQNEINEKVNADDKKTEKENEEVSKEMQRERSVSQELPREQEANTEEKSHSEEPNTLNSNKSEGVNTSPESSDLLNSSASEPLDDLRVTDKTNTNPFDDRESNIQNKDAAGLSVTDTTTVPLVSQASVESVDQFKSEKSDKEVLSAQFNQDIFGDSGTLAPTDPLAIQINTEESAEKPNEPINAPGVEGGDLHSGAFFGLNHEPSQGSTNPFGLPDSTTENIFVNTPGDIFSSSLSDAASSEATLAETFSLLDSQPISAESEVTLGMTDQLIVSNSAPVNQGGDQNTNPFHTSSQTREQVTDFDIFSSNDLFTQPPTDNVSDKKGADAFTNQPSAFDDDFFGISGISSSTDVFTTPPSIPATSDSLNDFFGSDASFTAAPSVQTDIFADDIFASQPQLLPVSTPSDANLFVDSPLVSDNNSQQTAGSTVTSSSWMDDLLG